MDPVLTRHWQDAERALAQGRFEQARTALQALVAHEPRHVPGWLQLSALATAAGRFRESVDLAHRARAVLPPVPALYLQVASRLLEVGESQAARALFERVLAGAATPGTLPAPLLAQAAFLAHQLEDHAAAASLSAQALAAGPDAPPLLALHATALTFCGRIDAAERVLEQCIAAAPGLASAHWTLSKLRRWSPRQNHIARLQQQLATVPAGDPAAPYLSYALFKELDDCGRDDEAWAALMGGCAAQRARVRYDGAAEAALFEQLIARCTPSFLSSQAPVDAGPVPIFIVGQPRSGTTVLERILGAHSQVRDAGELHDFPLQMAWACDHPSPQMLDRHMIARAPSLDYAELGRRYLERTRWRARGRPFYTDKLPRNFMQLGFIHKALPQARILHLVREPMDTCFSNLKELFGSAYPHSYDMAEMAHHFRLYQRLMQHWRTVLPGRFLDVRYESLVTEPERVAREVLAFCGLPWEPGCIAIEARTDASATASTVQVRDPIHARNIAQWQRYQRQLAPLQQQLAG